MTSEIFLSVIIPAYNEETRIAGSLEKISVYLEQQSYAYEIIIVDDGSTDHTVSLVKDILKRIAAHGTIIQNGVNRGKGYSVRQGVLRSRGKYVLFSDADLSTPIEELEKLLYSLEQGYDIAIGSRGLSGSNIRLHQVWYRERMGKMFNWIAHMLMLTEFSDTQCGFKCFCGDVARMLFIRQKIHHFSFDVEILFLATRYGYKIKEVPIQWINEPNSRVNVLYDSSRMLKDLLKIRYNLWTGKYNGL